MSNILDINSDSSDSENDCDYVPSEDDVSELSVDENDNDDEPEIGMVPENAANKKRGKRKENARCGSTKQNTGEKIQPALSEKAEKEHAENLWEDFLQDVNSQKGNCSSSLGNKSDSNERRLSQTFKSEEVKPKKVTITEVYDFAGESVVVSKEVDECSEEAKNSKKETCIGEEVVKIDKDKDSNDQEPTSVNKNKPPIAAKRASGLSSVIGSISNKKQKLSTLQKSLIDWKSFTKEEGLQEDLEHHKKSKGSYLENQAFLQRSDLRLFEIEKSVRLGNKTNR